MRQLIFLLFIFLLFAAVNCGKNKKPNCHGKIIIKNASYDTVIFALKTPNRRNSARRYISLIGKKFPPGKEWEYDAFSDINLSGCWENRISEPNNFELYVINPELYNNPLKLYACDSIEIKNKVLKKYSLTLQDLQNSNWTVTYP